MAERLQGKFGKYIIGDLLTEGGMATLYRATHPKHGDVGLKVLHEKLTEDEEILHRFWREMRLPEKLDHPSIARVLDAGVVGDRCYLALEWLPGDSLRVLLRKYETLPPGEVIRLIEPILDALDHAHRAGMVHRNLKPEHVILDADGNPKLVEFSLAKHFDGTVALTHTGEVFGTPWYMAPEQIRSTADVGVAADLYAVGVILYELVTGRVPFDGSDAMEVAHQQVKGIPRAPSFHVGGIPRELELVILKALEKNASDRFVNASSMKKALEYVREGRRTGIKLVSPVHWPARGRWKLMLVAVLLAVGVFAWRKPGLVELLLPGRAPPPPTPVATEAPPVRGVVDLLLEEYRELPLEAAAGFLGEHRSAIGGLEADERRRLAEGLRRLGEARAVAGELPAALVALRLSSKVLETPETHRALARALSRTGDLDRAAWHENRAAAVAGS